MTNNIQNKNIAVEVTNNIQLGTKKTLKSSIFQIVSPVKSLVLATLMTVSFSSAMAVLGGASQVSANPLQVQQANQNQIKGVIASPPSIVGNWKGSLYSQGDDAVTSVTMVINLGATKQGTWGFIGENNTPFESGAVVASVAGNKVTLEYKQANNQPSSFYKCLLQNNNKLSCELVGNTSIAAAKPFRT